MSSDEAAEGEEKPLGAAADGATDDKNDAAQNPQGASFSGEKSALSMIKSNSASFTFNLKDKE